MAQLLERESSKTPTFDPTFVPVESMDNKDQHKKFWIRPSTMEVAIEPPMFLSAEAGGILSEEMGAGKTIIVLSLILATRGQFSVPSSSTQNSETQTTLSMRQFPSSTARDLRERFGIPESVGLPSLVEVLLHFMASQQLPVKSRRKTQTAFFSSTLAPAFDRLAPFYFQQDVIEETGRRSLSQTRPIRQLFLSRATLVVVPASLYEQWKGEIYKFFWDDTLQVLFVNDTNGKLPNAAQLAKYDVSDPIISAAPCLTALQLVLATLECKPAFNELIINI